MNRRELLKYFSAGTIITPVAGAAVARLIEPAKVEPVKLELVKPFRPVDVERVRVQFEMVNGDVHTLDGATGIGVQHTRCGNPIGFDQPLLVGISVQSGGGYWMTRGPNDPPAVNFFISARTK